MLHNDDCLKDATCSIDATSISNTARLLMSGATDVAAIGYRVGYGSTAQFNREYRRQFGLPPGRDAAHLRGEAATA